MSAGRTNATKGIFGRRAKVMKDLVQLVDIAVRQVSAGFLSIPLEHSLSSLEDRLSGKKLGKDATDRPNVDGRALAHNISAKIQRHIYLRTHIIREAQHDLWSPVPPSRDIFGHESLVRSRPHLVASAARLVTSCQAEIANLQLAVSVDEEVSGFEIAMKDIRGMYVLQAAECLIDEGLEVRV